MAVGVQMLDAYLDALLDSDMEGARRVLDDALDAGVPARDLYLGVLQPALYEIGERWSRAEISIAQEHLATAATQSLMSRLAERLGTQPGRVSAALPERIPLVARTCAALRALEPRPFVVVGGQAFAGSRDRALAAGADAF